MSSTWLGNAGLSGRRSGNGHTIRRAALGCWLTTTVGHIFRGRRNSARQKERGFGVMGLAPDRRIRLRRRPGGTVRAWRNFPGARRQNSCQTTWVAAGPEIGRPDPRRKADSHYQVRKPQQENGEPPRGHGPPAIVRHGLCARNTRRPCSGGARLHGLGGCSMNSSPPWPVASCPLSVRLRGPGRRFPGGVREYGQPLHVGRRELRPINRPSPRGPTGHP